MTLRKTENLIYKMLTENTGSHFLDSGGAYGRACQRNQKLKLKDFKKRPECFLELTKRDNSIDADVTIDVFHYLTKNLAIDSICEKFNKKKVADWNSENFYGVSTEGEHFLLEHFEIEGDSFNTYNWSAVYSQVMQGCQLKHNETGDTYILLQIHGGLSLIHI